MSKDRTTSVNVDVGASARLEVRTEVPAKSSGRLVDALTDAIRPFTESRGLRADQIRLQREEVLIEVARLAATRRALEGETSFVPVPTRVLVPLLEKASLEHVDDKLMIERWAELLLSASRPGSIAPRLISILAELTSEQASLLQDVYFGRAADERKFAFDSVIAKPFNGVEAHIDTNDLKKLAAACAVDGKTPFDLLLGSFEKALCGPGLVMTGFQLSSGHSDPDAPLKLRRMGEWDQGLNIEVLRSLNLMERKRFDFEFRGMEFVVTFVQITDLGVFFLKRCSPDVRVSEESRENAWRS